MSLTNIFNQWLADLGGVFYSIKEKGYSARERRVTEHEFNRRMEIETQMAVDREKAAAIASKEAEKEALKRKQEGGTATVGIQPAVRRPKKGGGGSVVKRPPTKRVGRGF